MYLFYRLGKFKPRAIVDDEFVRDYITDDTLIVLEQDEDLHVYALIAVFQPLEEYQLRLF